MADTKALKWRSVRMFEHAKLDYVGKEERKALQPVVNKQVRACERKKARQSLALALAMITVHKGKVVVKNGANQVIETPEAGFGAELSTRTG